MDDIVSRAWAPIFQRYSAENPEPPWEDFRERFRADLPQQPLNLEPLTTAQLQKTLSRMSAQQAGGLDGWRPKELKKLPLPLVERAAELFDAIERVCTEHRPEEIVIGLPLNMDDSEGPAAKKMRVLAEKVLAMTSIPIHLHDERLTSFEANSRMARSGRTHGGKKKIRDAIAAATLLEDYLARPQ